MKKTQQSFINATKLCFLAIALSWAANSQAVLLLNFPFNEGTGTNTTDTASGLTGIFGLQQDPAVDYVQLLPTSPAGGTGDKCITNSGGGFLVVNDSSGPVLNFTNGPITIESWIYLDPSVSTLGSKGITGYGNSYKMGLRDGFLTFSLIGIAEMTNSAAGPVPSGQWVHVAAAWEPGAGVHFYINGVENFVADTNTIIRPPSFNYLGILSEGLANNVVAALDRLRIHHSLLTTNDIDSNAGSTKAPLASTVVAYNFNEPSFPSDNAIAPPRPTMLSSDFLPTISRPYWTNDTPTGLPGDFALGFNQTDPLVKERLIADYGTNVIDLAVNNTNYTLQTWVKLPARLKIMDRMVIYRTAGPAPRVSLSVTATRTLHTTLFGNTDFTSTVPIPNDNRWHHVAAVMENFARVRFYLDGVLRQTVNRTATAALTSSGTGNLQIGLESDARYFRGLLDRVRIHNDALTNSTLDYPAIPGLAIVTTQPVDIVASTGSNVLFSAAVNSASAATYQWRYRTNRADLNSIPVPGATNISFTLTNVSVANQGFYFMVISNSAGVSESYGAKLTVRAAPGTLKPLWRLAPGTTNSAGVTYLTSASDLERAMAYNPTTDHLLIPARTASQVPIKGIFIIRASDGGYVGELPNPGIVSGGTIYLTRIVVADDGAIYVCNFGTLSDTVPLKIYRWANETADPTLAYQGNPVSGTILPNLQWGKNMTIRGSGTNTQILMDTRNVLTAAILCLFTTTNGVDFGPTFILADARADDWFAGMTWGGDGDTFWGKNGIEPLYQWNLNLVTNGASLLRAFFDYPGDAFSNFTFNNNRRLMAGLNYAAVPYSVELWDVSDLNRSPILLDSSAFTTSAAHTLSYGNALFVGDRIYALIPNNGITAYTLSPGLKVARIGGTIVISWSGFLNGYTLQTTSTLTSPTWTTVGQTPTLVNDQYTVSIVADQSAGFYRLVK